MSSKKDQTGPPMDLADIKPPCGHCGYPKYPYPKSAITRVPKNFCRCGPPVTYHPDYAEQFVAHFKKPPVEEVQQLDYVDKNGVKFYKTIRRPSEFVTIESFARKIGISHERLLDWVKMYPEMASAYREAKQLYKEHLVTNGMLGYYNSAFTTFVAINTTDMKDKREVDNNNNLNVNISLTSLFNGASTTQPAIEGELAGDTPTIEGGHSDMAEDAEVADLRGANALGFTPATVETGVPQNSGDGEASRLST